MNAPRETGRLEHDVNHWIALFKNKNVEALKSLIEQWPSASMKNVAVDTIRQYTRPESLMLALNMLVESYSRGIDPELGITLSKAIYLYSQELFAGDPSTNHLYNAGRAAINCVIGLNALGRHDELIAFAASAERWCEERGHQAIKPDLLLYRIGALIDLARYEEAEVILRQTAWHFLLKDRPSDRIRKENLAQRVAKALRPPIDLPPTGAPMSDKETIIDNRRFMLESFGALTEILPPGEADMVKNFVTKSLTQQELEKDLPGSLGEWSLENQKRMDHLTDFLSGKSPKDILRDYAQAIGRPDLIAKLLGEASSLHDDDAHGQP
jgi:hypothetical protein